MADMRKPSGVMGSMLEFSAPLHFSDHGPMTIQTTETRKVMPSPWFRSSVSAGPIMAIMGDNRYRVASEGERQLGAAPRRLDATAADQTSREPLGWSSNRSLRVQHYGDGQPLRRLAFGWPTEDHGHPRLYGG